VAQYAGEVLGGAERVGTRGQRLAPARTGDPFHPFVVLARHPFQLLQERRRVDAVLAHELHQHVVMGAGVDRLLADEADDLLA
jgi:hypothetical protein